MGILHQKKLNSLLSLYCSTISFVNKFKEDSVLSNGRCPWPGLGVWTRWSPRSLPNQTVLGFYENLKGIFFSFRKVTFGTWQHCGCLSSYHLLLQAEREGKCVYFQNCPLYLFVKNHKIISFFSLHVNNSSNDFLDPFVNELSVK